MNTISIILGVPILIFQSCVNLAGYVCIELVSPLSLEEKCNFSKIICLKKNGTSFDMLKVQDSKEMEFNEKTVNILRHVCHYEINVFNDNMKVTNYFFND